MWPRPGPDRNRCCTPAPVLADPSGCRCTPAPTGRESSACGCQVLGCPSLNAASSGPPAGLQLPIGLPADRACAPASQAPRRERSGAACQGLLLLAGLI